MASSRRGTYIFSPLIQYFKPDVPRDDSDAPLRINQAFRSPFSALTHPSPSLKTTWFRAFTQMIRPALVQACGPLPCLRNHMRGEHPPVKCPPSVWDFSATGSRTERLASHFASTLTCGRVQPAPTRSGLRRTGSARSCRRLPLLYAKPLLVLIYIYRVFLGRGLNSVSKLNTQVLCGRTDWFSQFHFC